MEDRRSVMRDYKMSSHRFFTQEISGEGKPFRGGEVVITRLMPDQIQHRTYKIDRYNVQELTQITLHLSVVDGRVSHHVGPTCPILRHVITA